MSCRLPLAFLASVLLHLGLLFPDLFAPPAAPTPHALAARLRGPDERRNLPSDEALLKNTLSPQQAPAATRRTLQQPSGASERGPREVPKRTVEAAQKKLARHLYYPPEAVVRGLEGEVRLLLVLDDEGRIVDVSVAAGSGHALLDQAAVRAAWAMGRVSWASSRELILPVIFRLD